MPNLVIIVSSCHVNIVSPANPSEWDVSSSLASVITGVTRHRALGSWRHLVTELSSPSLWAPGVTPQCLTLDSEVCWVVSVLHDGWPGSRIRNQCSQYLINWVTSKVNSLQIFGFLTISEFDMFTLLPATTRTTLTCPTSFNLSSRNVYYYI